MGKTEELFKNPTAEYRGKPFWSWNGKLEKSELLRQIEVFRQMGMGGYFCHSRIGLETEYLGNEWFDLINSCAEKGASLGMETWLYDEDRWPSGIAGGMVTKHRENRMKFLRMTVLESCEDTDRTDAVAVFAVNLDGLSFSGKERISSGSQAGGRTVLKFTVEDMVREDSCNGYTYLDTMKREATECFIKETHEKYREHCGKHFGKEILGIFTDEPHRGAIMAGFGNSNPDSEYLLPFTDKLFDEFESAYGYDLRDFLPELYLWKDGEKVSPVKWQYMELTERLFLENFLAPIHDWCRKNNMLFTGHLLHEDSLTAQTTMIGSIMRAYEYMDVPGVDVLTEHNYCFWIVKQLQSAARQLGKNKMLSELYGVTGWQFDFESHKSVGDWQALFGINLRCHHLSWYSMRGEGKRDYPASISYQSAWYPYYSYVEDYFSRLNVFLEQGEPVCDLLVLNPVESLWCRIYPKWSWQLVPIDEEVREAERMYEETFRTLCAAKMDFDYGDEDFIKRMGSVEELNGETVLRIGKSVYRKVLVTGMSNMRRTTLGLLKEFADKGGSIIVAGSPPRYIDAVASDEAAKLPAVYTARENMVQALGILPQASVKDAEGREIGDIYIQLRRDGENLIAVLMNINRLQAYYGASVEFSAGGFCERWDPRSGEIRLLAKGDRISFKYDFEPSAELCLVITAEDRKLAEEPQTGKLTGTVSLGSSFDYRLDEPNVCLLNFVDYTVENGETVFNKDILEADREIRDIFGLPQRGGQMLQPWFSHGKNDGKAGRVRLSYSFRADYLPDELFLAVESPDDFEIEINANKGAFEKTDKKWVDPCFSVLRISKKAFKAGRNEITLSCDFKNSLNLEAVYLLGDFAVGLDEGGAVLKELPERILPGDITAQGFPFYGAGITYFADLPVSGEGRRVLQTDGYGAALIVVSDGCEEKGIWARPYRADITGMGTAGGRFGLKYVLTRTNTFGIKCAAGGQNGSFYHPLPQGMTAGVRLCRYE